MKMNRPLIPAILLVLCLVSIAYAGNIGEDTTFKRDLTVKGNASLGDAATDTVTVTGVLQGASPLAVEGATADAYETTIAVTDPTADRTITLPDATGKIVVTNNLTTWGALLWGSSDDTTDTGNEVCTGAGLTCVDVKTVAGVDSDCTTDQGTAGTYFYALCK